MTTGPLNGVQDAHAINAVYWTLAYEWLFYLALPLLALLARGPWSALPLVAVLYFGAEASMVYNFLFGALAALFVQRRLLEPRLFLKGWLAPLPLVALGAYFAVAGERRLLESALLFVFFLFVVHGYSLFGLLHTRPAKLLGMVSYSLYLTHCIVLYAAMHAADRMVAVGSLHATQYWLLAALAALGAVLLSCLTYRYVEFPFIHPQAQPNPNRRHSWTQGLISGW
jgi:peptidoglycan/LPS O-acetylase OafA/YrhL